MSYVPLGDMWRVLFLGVLGCGVGPARGVEGGRAVVGQAPRLRFVVEAADGALEVDVRMSARRMPNGELELPWSGIAGAVRRARVVGDGGRALPLDAESWNVPECTRACELEYTVNVAAFRQKRRFEEGVGTDTTVVTTVRMVLARPTDYDGEVRVAGTDAPRLRSGLQPVRPGEDATFPGDAWDESSFMAVGDLACASLRSAGTRYCIVGRLQMSSDTFGAGLSRAYDGVARFYGRAPAGALTVFAVAVPRQKQLVFGKVRATGGPSITYFVGERFARPEDDWVMVHELLHLGFPTLYEARWFSEGIATVYEPIIRHRMGDLDEATVWKGFADNLSRGLSALSTAGGVEASEGIDAMYWASSALLFEWEHALCAATNGVLGAEDALAKLARATPSHATPAQRITDLDAVVTELDRLTDTTALARSIAATRTQRTVTLRDLLGPFGVDDRGRIVDTGARAIRRRQKFLRGN